MGASTTSDLVAVRPLPASLSGTWLPEVTPK